MASWLRATMAVLPLSSGRVFVSRGLSDGTPVCHPTAQGKQEEGRLLGVKKAARSQQRR
jgi:hypothetical protein